MHDASLCGNLELVQLLHAQGASLTAPDSDGYTPFDLSLPVYGGCQIRVPATTPR